MSEPSLFLITERTGFSPHLSRLVSMMNYTRATTLQEVQHLRTEELDLLPDPKGNSIAMLLEHMAGVEVAYQALSFETRELTEAELAKWNPSLELGAVGRAQIKGKPLEHYLNQLQEVREHTLEQFRLRDDAWLHTEFPFWDDALGNHYFCWFHVFEDELNHRGQIRLLKKSIPRYANRGVLGGQLNQNESGLGIHISKIFKDGPLERASLRENDEIVEYNGKNIEHLLLKDVDFVDEAGSSASFTVRRTGELELLRVVVVRAARANT